MKKLALLVSTSIISLLAVGVCAFSVFSNNQNVESPSASGYYVTLNADNAYHGVDQEITTSSGQWQIPFHYKDATHLDEYHVSLSKDGYIVNTDTMKSVLSILPVYSGGALKARFSYDKSVWSNYYELANNAEYYVSSEPYYVELKAFDATVDIKSVTFSYSCAENTDIDNTRLTGKTFTVYTTNDIHGVVEEEPGHMGVKKMMTYLKNHDDEKTLMIDQGDTWQGSIYSNDNFGALINDIMCHVGYDARTIGNHDFDWEEDKLIANTNRTYDDYRIPVLGANIYAYNYKTKQTGEFRSDLAQKSIIYEIDGVKIGIVGVIGETQISSICSLLTNGVSFLDETTVVEEEAAKLREAGCDVVITSMHEGAEQVGEAKRERLAAVSDLVLCGHKHIEENITIGDVRFVQTGVYTENIGKVDVTIDPVSKRITSNFSLISAENVCNEIDDEHIDSTIQDIADTYIDEELKNLGKKTIIKDAFGEFDTGRAATLMLEAAEDVATKNDIDVDIFVSGKARQSFGTPGKHSEIKYEDIFKTFTFDNRFYILDVPGSELLRSVRNFRVCIPGGELLVEKDKTYKVACIDYNAFLIDENRDYVNFPIALSNVDDFSELDTLPGTYRDIVTSYLIDNGYDQVDGEGNPIKTLNYSDYHFSSNPKFDYSNVKECCTVTLHNVNPSDLSEVQVDTVARYDFYSLPQYEGNPDFSGWYYDEELTNPCYNTSIFITSSIELYAKWAGPIYYGGISIKDIFVGSLTRIILDADNGSQEEIVITYLDDCFDYEDEVVTCENAQFILDCPIDGYVFTYVGVSTPNISDIHFYDMNNNELGFYEEQYEDDDNYWYENSSELNQIIIRFGEGTTLADLYIIISPSA